MANYVSRHTGQELDQAISYYRSFQNTKTSKQILTVDVTETNWHESSAADKEKGNYYISLLLTGISNIGQYPSVYMMVGPSGSGGNVYEKWELGYNTIFGGSSATITCYSNKQVAGKIVLVCTDQFTTSPSVSILIH